MAGRALLHGATLLLPLYLAGCNAALGYPYQYQTHAERSPRPARGYLSVPRGRDVASDGHATFVAADHDVARTNGAPPDLVALKHSLGEACSWLENARDAGAKHARAELEEVVESCRTLLVEAEAWLPQHAATSDAPRDAAPLDAPPQTLVGAVASGYEALLPFVSSEADVPVEMLVEAIEAQATHSQRLGAFMQLIVKVDRDNMCTVRSAWERHGCPDGLRTLLEAELATGVQQPTRLAEGSAALSLLWSMRMKRFWTTMADGFADTGGTEPTSAFGIRAYETEVEPYHGFLLRNTFRTGLRALPSREAMLRNMEAPPDERASTDASPEAAELTADQRRAACLTELRQCSGATRHVTDYVQAMLDEFGMRDDRRL